MQLARIPLFRNTIVGALLLFGHSKSECAVLLY